MKDKNDAARTAAARLDASVLELEESAKTIKRFASLSRDADTLSKGMSAGLGHLERASNALSNASASLSAFSLEALRKEIREDRKELQDALGARLEKTHIEVVDRQREIAKTVSTLQSHVTAETLSLKEDLRRGRELAAEAAGETAKRDSRLQLALIAVAVLQAAVLASVWLKG